LIKYRHPQTPDSFYWISLPRLVVSRVAILLSPRSRQY